MTFARTPGLLTALRNVFGEPVLWRPPDSPAPLNFPGRFRIDPQDVSLDGQPEPLSTTQTWVYLDRADVRWATMPEQGDCLVIRGKSWEIVDVNEDDIGELAFRLLQIEMPPRGTVGPRRPGRPSRRAEIEAAYDAVAAELPADAPLTSVFPTIRQAITGSARPSKGLTDKTLRKTLAPVRRRTW